MTPVLAFAGFSLVELYFFLLQRSALEISRRRRLDPVVGRYMLPLWYAAVWPVTIAKWVTLWFVFRSVGLWAVIACVVAGLVLTSIAPVPHGHFRPMFQRRVDDLLGEEPEIAAKLIIALMDDA